MNTPLPVLVFSVCIAIAALFQLALAFGMPWGKLAMGGKYPGRFPPLMRFLALVQLCSLVLLAVVVSVRAEVLLPAWFEVSQTAIWVVVGVCAISLLANLATPSKWERIIWAPVALTLLICSVLVALR